MVSTHRYIMHGGNSQGSENIKDALNHLLASNHSASTLGTPAFSRASVDIYGGVRYRSASKLWSIRLKDVESGKRRRNSPCVWQRPGSLSGMGSLAFNGSELISEIWA